MEFSTCLLACITVITALVLLYKYLTKDFGYWESQGVPCDKAYPLVGTEYGVFKKSMHEIDLERAKKHGRIYGGYALTGKMIIINDPEILKSILVKDFHVFINRQIQRSGIKIFDSGLVAAVNDQWKRIRSVVSPTFSSGKIKKMSTVIADISRNLTENMMKIADEGDPVNIKPEFSKFAIEVMGGCAFGIRFNAFKNSNHPFIENTTKLQESGTWKILLFFAIGMLPKMFKRLKRRMYGIFGFSYFTQTAVEIIQDRRAAPAKKNFDFLQLMLDAKEEKIENSDEEQRNEIDKTSTPKVDLEKTSYTKTLDEEEIIAQCTNFLLAGNDTVASALAYVAYNLARHLDIQNKLLAEIDEAWDSNEDVNYEIINSMTYLNAVVSETLRLQTIAVRLMRQANQDYTIPNTNIVIPKNTVVYSSTYSVHHDPEFFPDPEKFDPDRFLPENKVNIRPFTYMPFGDGPRNCVAMRFALIEIKICLAHLLRYVKFCPTEETMKPLKSFSATGILQSKVIVRPEKRREFLKGK